MEVEAENDPQLDGNNNVTEIEERFSNGTEDAQDTPQGVRFITKNVEIGFFLFLLTSFPTFSAD